MDVMAGKADGRMRDLLSDRDSLYRHIGPGTTPEVRKELDALHDRYSSILQRSAELDTRKKVLSGRIGKARRDNGPADSLIGEMQEVSSKLKLAAGEAERIEERIRVILGIPPTDTDEVPDTGGEHDARYPDSAVWDAGEVNISLLANDHDEWNGYVDSHPCGTIYHRTEWNSLIQDAFGHKGYYFIARGSNGKVVGVLPLVRFRSLLFGDFMVSMPFFNYGGAIADHREVENRLMQHAGEVARSTGLQYIEFRDSVRRDNLPLRTGKVNMILALPDSTDELWNRFNAKLRAQIRRPQRENPDVLTGGAELLDDFYSVFAHNMRDLGTPVYGKYFFRSILQYFPDHVRIVVLRQNNKPVSAAFLVGYRDMLEIPWASTLRRVNRTSMNMLMYWEVLCLAIRSGYKKFDFGRSSVDSGTYRFKQQWGAQPRELFWHYWLAPGVQLPALNPENPRFRLLIAIWKRLPVSLSRVIGPPVIRNIP